MDYVICDKNLLNIVSKMEVVPPHFGSVHTPISFKLNSKQYTIQNPEESFLPFPPAFQWDPDKAETIPLLLRTSGNINSINAMIDKLGNDYINKCDIVFCFV